MTNLARTPRTLRRPTKPTRSKRHLEIDEIEEVEEIEEIREIEEVEEVPEVDDPEEAVTEAEPTEDRPRVLALAVPQLDGTTFDVSSLAGRDVLLWFWAPW